MLYDDFYVNIRSYSLFLLTDDFLILPWHDRYLLIQNISEIAWNMQVRPGILPSAPPVPHLGLQRTFSSAPEEYQLHLNACVFSKQNRI